MCLQTQTSHLVFEESIIFAGIGIFNIVERIMLPCTEKSYKPVFEKMSGFVEFIACNKTNNANENPNVSSGDSRTTMKKEKKLRSLRFNRKRGRKTQICSFQALLLSECTWKQKTRLAHTIASLISSASLCDESGFFSRYVSSFHNNNDNLRNSVRDI